MNQGRNFVAYFRVDGVPLEEQEHCVEEHVREAGGAVVQSFREDENLGKTQRPKFLQAIASVKELDASLIVASLSGLSKDVRFLQTLHRSHIPFLACDFPHANERTIEVLAALAEYESDVASNRMKLALAAYKARGGKLGAARPGSSTLTAEARSRGVERASQVRREQANEAYREIVPMIAELRNVGFTLQEIADRLNEAGHLTRRGHQWKAMQVSRVLKRERSSGGDE